MGAASSAIDLGYNTVGNVVSGLISNLFYRRNLNLQTAAQKSLIDYQNEYNSPTAQMQRLQEAGLNPNLVYGSSAPAGVSGNAAAPAGAMPASHNSNDIAAAMAHISQMRQADSAVELNKALASKAAAEANYVRSQDQYYPEYIQSVIRRSNQEIFTLASQEKLNISSANLNEAKKTLTEAQEAYMRGEISLQSYKKQEMIANTQLLAERARTEQMSRSLMQSQIGVNVEQASYYRIQTALGEIQSKYDQITKNGGQALLHNRLFNAYVKATANELGIHGSKAVIWTNQIIDWLKAEKQLNPLSGVQDKAAGAAMQLAL